jgi:hypothetical protein
LNLAGWLAGYTWVADLLIWWMKPLFDRIPLFVLSRHLFNETPGTAGTLRAVPGLWRAALPGALLWSRFDSVRSFNMPVAQLEGLRGRARIRRQRLLQKPVRGQAIWITVGCAHIALFFVLSAWALLLLLVPFQYLPESAKAMWSVFIQHTTPTAQLALNLMAYLAMSAVEPFYVASGFGLYLNRRTELEAWDVELVFRRIAKRLRAYTPAAALAFAALTLFSVHMPAAHAAGNASNKQHRPTVSYLLPGSLHGDADARMRRAVKKAYKNENLSPEIISHRWRPRHFKGSDARKTIRFLAWLGKALLWFRHVSAGLGRLIGWVLWLFVAMLALLLIILGIRHKDRLMTLFSLPPRHKQERHKMTESPVDTAARLPGDVSTVARTLWQRDDRRGALALLYRGAIDRVGRLTGASIPVGATENQCLRQADALPEPARRAFFATVRAWQYAAYAHRLPAEDVFETLATDWSDAFEGRA